MVEISYGKHFLVSAGKIPLDQQKKLAKLLTIIHENPYHPQLHSKPLRGELSGLYSFRITRDWRVIFQFVSPDSILLINVSHRKDIYR